MSNEIPLDVLTNYNDLNTVIEELIKLRNKHGGKSTVDLFVSYEPYEDSIGYVEANLIVPEND